MYTYNYICVHTFKIWIHTILLVYRLMYTYNNMSSYTIIEILCYIHLYEYLC